MKVAFDENMPAAVVRILTDLAAEKGFRRYLNGAEIVSAKDYTPGPDDPDYIRKSDVPWIKRYAADGGRVIISGNTEMPNVPQEMLALVESGMVVFFFPPIWNGWLFPRKAAMILAWIERILRVASETKPPALFRVPNDWKDDAGFLVIATPTPLALKPRGKAAVVTPKGAAGRVRRSAAKPLAEPGLLVLMRGAARAKTEE